MISRLRVDLHGSTEPTLGPGWLSVVVEVDRPSDWDDNRLRSEAARHFAVPVHQVEPPTVVERCPRHSDWCDGAQCRERGIDCPNADPA